MSDVREFKVRDYLVSHEVYLQMKYDQKAQQKSDNLPEITEYENSLEQWKKDWQNYNYSNHTIQEYDERQKALPEKPWIMVLDARSLNIVYSMIKGKSYKQIEKKVHEHNEPVRHLIESICKHYGIDMSKLGGIEYGK